MKDGPRPASVLTAASRPQFLSRCTNSCTGPLGMYLAPGPGEAAGPWIRVSLGPGSGRGRGPLDPAGSSLTSFGTETSNSGTLSQSSAVGSAFTQDTRSVKTQLSQDAGLTAGEHSCGGKNLFCLHGSTTKRWWQSGARMSRSGTAPGLGSVPGLGLLPSHLRLRTLLHPCGDQSFKPSVRSFEKKPYHGTSSTDRLGPLTCSGTCWEKEPCINQAFTIYQPKSNRESRAQASSLLLSTAAEAEEVPATAAALPSHEPSFWLSGASPSTPTGGALLSQKPGSQLVSTAAVAEASPTSVAMLRMSADGLGHQLDIPQGLPECERTQARLRDGPSTHPHPHHQVHEFRAPRSIPGAPSAPRRGRGCHRGGRGRFGIRRDGPMKFEKDFDFESANAQFNKEEIDREFHNKLKLKVEDKLEKQEKPVNGEDKGDSGVDTQNSEGNADEEDPLGPNCYYDKTKSFFDNISCDDNRPNAASAAATELPGCWDHQLIPSRCRCCWGLRR
ncbi:hypothetical protein QTO34_010513 [Cnephaeus nilssonii]|uniref:Uncharacterized protein n=1 Tax=Cnephaeus nilssonii TaxID=3371016 RepID=A0AA40HFI6_CNENI|nr:hypothetical protein QTO34_010513 [Eptesicus nilssonii]